jgi:excisionase family DNA binding protein
MAKNKGYTSREAAAEVGVSDSRIRQLALAGEIEHYYFGRSLVITARGIQQAKARKKKPGPKPSGNKAA